MNPLAEALEEARRRGEEFRLMASEREDLLAIVAIWNSDRKRRGLAFNMTPREALSRLLSGFREDLEQIAKEEVGDVV
jgi:hypothetical protein